MPPRKSDQSRKNEVSTARSVVADDEVGDVAAPASNTTLSSPPQAQPSEDAKGKQKESKEPKEPKETKDAAVSIEDLNLPKSIITRLAKGVLSPNSQVQANAILAISKSATVFINYLASHANEHTQNANKKTIMPQDVFKALEDIEFPFLLEPLKAEFAKYSDIQTAKRTSYRKKVAAAKKGTTDADSSMLSAPGGDDTEMEDTRSEPSASAAGPKVKKPRLEPGTVDVDEPDAVDDDETEVDEQESDDDREDADEVDDEEEEEEEEDGARDERGDETQDPLEEKKGGDEEDSADESD